MVPVLTGEIARRIEVSEIEMLNSRLTAIQNIPGNPVGVEVAKFGQATAFSVKGIPGPAFNTVRGLTSDDTSEVDKILDFYNEKDIPIQIEITPACINSELLKLLASKGVYQSNFHSVLYGGQMGIYENVNSSISIQKLKEDEFDLFAEIYLRGFGLPEFIKPGIAQNNQVLYPLKEWEFYLATNNGEPAGIGVMFYQNGVATLAASATVPEHRKQGVHRALLKERIKDAHIKGAELVVGQAKYASVSSNNMEKLGLRVAYTKSIWVRN
ncbi:GNAT family N-acetyltransferase [Paucisalibacillus sp. EB02]|uniref:GNAT family N-acetyltransferase n=1 Tax=Paucisalibacillus sp. EB02 TaxID=1347087 RepID=UPI0004ADABDB|nr:GNAT family N-acetyltransferase [Paucisalibacillus sp. EB02]